MVKVHSVVIASLASLCALAPCTVIASDEVRIMDPKPQRGTRLQPVDNAPTISELHSARGVTAAAPEKSARVSKVTGLLVPAASEGDGGVAGLVNNACANSLPISGSGPFNFNSGAGMTTDGPAHAACNFNGETQINNDEWFCWTAPVAPCDGEFVLSTCGSTNVDTKAAIYTGCTCPVDNARLIECSDDDCGTQTMISFNPTPGQQYLIRLGVFPGAAGGAGTFSVACHANELPCQQSSDNCQVPSQDDGINSNGEDFIVADDFTPTTSGNITSLCFWGGYVASQGGTNCAGVSADNFIVRYYSSVDGRPGALLAAYSQTGGTLAVTGPEPTGLSISSNVPEYEFSATHAPLAVTAGDCYWIEITNEILGCSWFWELGNIENERAFQDGRSGFGPDGYDPEETLVADLAFCVGQPLGDPTDCYPPVPANDNCANAQAISVATDIPYDLASATQDGPGFPACLSFGQTQIGHDVWYCWTSPCTATAFVRTCGDTSADTKISVYDGCTCPPAEADVLACNDDLCGPDGLQSMVTFEAVQGQSYLIRLGTYPLAAGGAGILHVSCGPPDNPACPGSGSCCESQDPNPGCGSETCCETVCACDPFCCELEWDAGCATTGFGDSGCGADELCGCGATCGSPNAGDCCAAHETPACDDATCCQTVCECDAFCCTTEWDQFCAGHGSVPSPIPGLGCGAADLCTDLCSNNCPLGTIAAVSPANNVVDARRHVSPANPPDPPLAEGLSQVVVSGPAGADPGCFALCETGVLGSPNFVANVSENAGVYTLTFDRPITRGHATTITYTDNNSTATTLTYISHPGNVNNNTVGDAGDVTALAVHLTAGSSLPWGAFSGDINRSGLITPLDLLTLVDVFNGTAPYNDATWLGYQKPAAAPICP